MTERHARKLVGFGTIDESLSGQESRSEQKADTTGEWLETCGVGASGLRIFSRLVSAR